MHVTQPGVVTQGQLRRLGQVWQQGEHILITGPTGSGKTALARHVVQQRLDRKGFVCVMVCKLREDETIKRDYAGWTRWKTWKKKPGLHEDRILLWPDTGRMGARAALNHQRNIFGEAFDAISKAGKWTLQVDEGLYTASPTYLNMAHELGMLHALGRSSGLTIVTLAQRPSHLPVIIYSSASHAFVGRMRERADLARLSELGGKESSKELGSLISDQGRHDFLWVPVAPDWNAEHFNLRK